MGEKDIVLREAMTDSRSVVAEVFNRKYLKRDRIKPESLNTSNRLFTDIVDYQDGENPIYLKRERDLLFEAVIMDGPDEILILLAIENQSTVDYFMIFRVMEYDSLAYRREEKNWKEQRRLYRERMGKTKEQELDAEILASAKKSFRPCLFIPW